MQYRSSLALLVFLALASPASADKGDVVATFPFAASKFVLHPNQPILYATVPGQNAVAEIHTVTHELLTMNFVGSNPSQMACSPDGSRLFVTFSGANQVAVVDTDDMQVVDTYVLPHNGYDIEYGLGDRLFISGTGFDDMMQVDANTGALIGTFGSSLSGSGVLEISPDKTRLYWGKIGGSPSSLAEFDVSLAQPSQTWKNDHGSLGSNGQDLAISHAGDFVSYPCGSGNGSGYAIAKIATSNKAILGYFNTGAYPREITFSPDDATAYAVHFSGHIDVYDTQTFLDEGPIQTSGEAFELIVEGSGRYLFAAFSGELRVYETGEAVLPLVIGVSPDHMEHDATSLTVSLQGDTFLNSPVTGVFFGDQPATNVTVLTDDLILCEPPAGAPGPVDVRVETDLGSNVLPNGFIYTPAMIAGGELELGGQIALEYRFNPGDYVFTAWGELAGPGIPVPGFAGSLCLLDPVGFLEFYGIGSGSLSLQFDVPNDPALSGYEFHLQAVAAADPTLSGGVFTNCVPIHIGS